MSSDPINTLSSPMNSKPRSSRVLSCVLCQQRKVKCDREFPCSNCRRSGAECVSTPQPQPRRRRFAERELLHRLRNYEDLLRQHHVDFKPMHTADASVSQDPEILAQHDTGIQSSTFEGPVDGSGNSDPAYGVHPRHCAIVSIVADDNLSVDFFHAVKKMVGRSNLPPKVVAYRQPHINSL